MSAYYHIDYGRRKRGKLRFYIATIMIIFVGGLVYNNAQSDGEDNIARPSVSAIGTDRAKRTIDAPITWPTYGHAAYTIKKKEEVASSDSNTDIVPTASLAKVITALAVLEKKPLEPGEEGPVITLDDQDAALYEEYLRKNGAVLPAEAGLQISQHDALQAMLMVSANNVSDILVRWAFGSMDEYTEYANNMVKELGLTKTKVADASGFSPQTVSTAEEMTQLGILYMENPVLENIAMKSEATIPAFGKIQNYNSIVDDSDEIIGIKVGDTDQAGRCFMAADTSGDSTSVAVVLGAENFIEAINDTREILKTGKSAYNKSNR